MAQKQQYRLLDFMYENGTVNPLLAWRRLGISRLSARIYDLKNDGWEITTERMTVTNQFNEKCSVAIYSLTKEDRRRYEKAFLRQAVVY